MITKQEVIKNTKEIINNNEWDQYFGGLFSAFKGDNQILSREKFLYDQVIGLLNSIESNDKVASKKYLIYVKKWLENDTNPSLIKEEYGNNIDMGLFKDSEKWYEIADILKYCSLQLDDETLNKKADQIAKDLDSYMYVSKMNSYLSKASIDWRTSVDGMLNNNTLVLAAIFSYLQYVEHKNNQTLNRMVGKAKQVRLIMTHDSFYVSYRNLDGSMSIHSKITLKGQCLAMLLFKLIGNEINNHIFKSIANDIADYTNEHFWDSKYYGYFSFIDADEKITIHKEYVSLLTEKTPAKLTFDNAFMLYTLSFIKWNTLSDQNKLRFKKAVQYFMTLYDNKNKGFFIGEGYFWAAPGIPVGPFLRSVAPSPETPGVFNLGTKKFLNFYYKFPKTQAMAGIALNSIADEYFTIEQIDYKLPFKDKKFNLVDVKYDPLHEKKVDLSNYIDIDKHLQWIYNSYTPHESYGWTPYEAPLSIKSDKTPSVFGAQHALANLVVLGGKIADKAEMAHWIMSTQKSSGAFCETPGGPEDVLDTYLAVDALSMLGQLNLINKDSCIHYLQACQNEDGGFGINPGYKSDMFHSNLALATLYLLGAEPNSAEKLIEYTLATQQNDGGFAEYYIGTSDTYSCFRAVSTFSMYGLKIPNQKKTIQFLQGCQNSDGGFAQDHNGSSSLIATYHAVASLFMLHASPVNIEDCLNFLAKCQTPDGGISNIPGKNTGTIDEGFAGIQSLAILTKQLDRGFAVLNS
ncbi:prenyltransferase/squalene oxidase repeat-containing protein [Pediococcus acidilactici]|uniref:prenyltransferase/squalene oxidase repeat-containing protein n=1 Tax=Pediococcus acidilactici TaxID=1254 RepID=UPI00232DD389|nr:prenyltransferase/squalene oxidase repeat-containing protein [Pediococcus acidilactici]MDB8858651.1 prenyltransferase/squalene oxidase repeat-containing protein [Pediococcus acidilactici]MDB8860941.1 prenyltransferase/squalene oxidase repeat-containing protein [Pediococcus acidilactici]MDB8862167.1 prenyltransferase/squalene oxidase repeat-containing protein [Pediococcus acidilactici]